MQDACSLGDEARGRKAGGGFFFLDEERDSWRLRERAVNSQRERGS